MFSTILNLLLAISYVGVEREIKNNILCYKIKKNNYVFKDWGKLFIDHMV
jgi:endonuclease III-like uncharacterized protein